MSQMRIECGNAVQVLEKVGRLIKVGDARYWVSTQLPYMNVEDSAGRFSEQQPSPGQRKKQRAKI